MPIHMRGRWDLVTNIFSPPLENFATPARILPVGKISLCPSNPTASKAVYSLRLHKTKTPSGICFARPMGFEPTFSSVTGRRF